MVCACEDVGLAWPQIIPIVKAAVDIANAVGLPEAQLPLADAVVLVATAPKSNSAHDGIHAAIADIQADIHTRRHQAAAGLGRSPAGSGRPAQRLPPPDGLRVRMSAWPGRKLSPLSKRRWISPTPSACRKPSCRWRMLWCWWPPHPSPTLPTTASMPPLRTSRPTRADHQAAAGAGQVAWLEAGDLPSACRRLMVCACEDVGLAWPQIIPIVKAAVDIANAVGLPEAQLPLADAVVLVATAPKSNSAHDGIHAAIADIQADIAQRSGGRRWAGRLLEAGDLPSACRRLMVCACEDVGLAWPQIIPIVKAAVDIANAVGLPEAQLPLADAVVLVATAPKSNSAHDGIHAAIADIQADILTRADHQAAAGAGQVACWKRATCPAPAAA